MFTFCFGILISFKGYGSWEGFLYEHEIMSSSGFIKNICSNLFSPEMLVFYTDFGISTAVFFTGVADSREVTWI